MFGITLIIFCLLFTVSVMKPAAQTEPRQESPTFGKA